MILNEEIKSFLMDNTEDMQKVLIQEIRDKFIEKVEDKIVWKQGFRVRMQEMDDYRKLLAEKEITPRLVIREDDVRDLDKTAEVCAELLRPIFGTVYIEKIRNDALLGDRK
ncbi:MAG: hypothetical protein ACTSQA_00020 [Candidatus Heimdallarchaeaceae archaeon]